ncbi:TonB-linked outer membrane protein, SusC/RagA family [Elysia marginata]|uniref:Single-stranded-DNA-specific exonuclease RecJ n=1 Tax=Elysia marginata TaxID=1093978 RepID=A0AAV4F0A3_9GAST|nr:TonB-linked outer membrane protein, SusC/RagA family [Elysia marginata]
MLPSLIFSNNTIAPNNDFVFRQSSVTGIVSDENGTPISGVAVRVKGEKRAVQTDLYGSYSISVKVDDVLVFSYLGYLSQEKKVSGKSQINVQMIPSAEELEGVILLGYGKTNNKSFTGSIKKVEKKNIESKNVSNIAGALAGEVAGVRVFNISGQPGSKFDIVIRGFGSVNSSTEPLFVVDGVPFSGDLTDINPSDVESTVVLKDAASTSIYGSRGANGVILINTKSGAFSRDSYIEVETRLGRNASLLPRNEVIKSPEEYIGYAWESLYNKGVIKNQQNDPSKYKDPVAYANENLFSEREGINPFYNIWKGKHFSKLIDSKTRKFIKGTPRRYDPENWEDYGIRYGIRSETNLRIGGGGKGTSYYASLGYLNDEGHLVQTGYERFAGRINLRHRVKKWLESAMNMAYTVSKASDSRSIFSLLDSKPPIYPLFLRDDDGKLVEDTHYGGYQYDYGMERGFAPSTNSIADAYLSPSDSEGRAMTWSASLDIKPFKGLSIENKLGIQDRIYDSVDFENPFYGFGKWEGGSVFRSRSLFSSYNLLNLMRYKYSKSQHSAEILVAHEFNDNRSKSFSGSGIQLGLPFVKELSNTVANKRNGSSTSESSIESYFGQLNYNYARKYYLLASLRRDGTSKFRNNKWGTFGAFGLSWLASEESFMKNIDIVKFLKVKVSYGLQGNQPYGYYTGYDTYKLRNLDDKSSYTFAKKGNPDLTWETSKMFQTGIELQLGEYLDLNVDYFIKNTVDLLSPVQRGIDTFDKAKSFFRPSLQDLHNPFLMKDMDKATGRIQKALSNSEKIMILGDYDVDGVTSVSLLYTYLKKFTNQLSYYIPDRYKEGYGVSEKSVESAERNNVRLIISLDCGIKAQGNIEKAKARDIDFIVCDHHKPSNTLPPANAILNPKQVGCSYPYKELCGCGVTFKLVEALSTLLENDHHCVYEYLDLVCVAIAADIVPITGENRVFATFGLEQLKKNPRLCFKTLIPEGVESLDISDIVFKIAPIINASGRINHACEAVKLVIERDPRKAKQIAEKLIHTNTQRKKIEKEIVEEAFSILEKENHECFSNVLYKADWHKGVIGIVASRVIESFYKPTIIFTESNGNLVGSARSIKGFDIYQAIETCADVVEAYGGHTHAAGITILKENYLAFKSQFEIAVKKSIDKSILTPTITANISIQLSEITPKLCRILKQFEPFGPGNMRPLFFSKNIHDTGYAKCLGDDYQHLKTTLTSEDSDNYFSALGFNIGDKYDIVAEGKNFKAIYSIEENTWRDKKKIQLRIRDINP